MSDQSLDPRTTAPDGRPRARGLGIPLPGVTGPANAITDVPGVTVGQVTLISGEGPLVVGQGPVRTGVTAILPRGADGVGDPCAAGWYSLNGNGEMTGTTWISEVGALASPVLVTNTHSVGACHEGAIAWVGRRHPQLAAAWLLPVVAETWDGFLNDINGFHVRPEHAQQALDGATGGPVAEGSVGGGTAMNCYGFSGGSGTSSRRIPYGSKEFTVGAFVQANFGDRAELTVAGVPLGGLLADDDPLGEPGWFPDDVRRAGAGSVIVVIATDAPLSSDQCRALTRRVPLGLARTGTAGSHFSGDIFLAFSTANRGALRSTFPAAPPDDDAYDRMTFLQWGHLDPFLTAVVECVEEAVLNALVVNRAMDGRDGRRVPAMPHDRVVAALRAAGRLA